MSACLPVCTCEGGRQPPVQGGQEEAGRQGDAEGVVSHGPAEVELDPAEHHPGQVQGRHHVEERVPHDHDVRRLARHTGARTDRYAHVRLPSASKPSNRRA